MRFRLVFLFFLSLVHTDNRGPTLSFLAGPLALATRSSSSSIVPSFALKLLIKRFFWLTVSVFPFALVVGDARFGTESINAGFRVSQGGSLGVVGLFLLGCSLVCFNASNVGCIIRVVGLVVAVRMAISLASNGKDRGPAYARWSTCRDTFVRHCNNWIEP